MESNKFAAALDAIIPTLAEGLDLSARNYVVQVMTSGTVEEGLEDLENCRGGNYGGEYLADAARRALAAM